MTEFRAQNLGQGIVIKPSFETRIVRMGLNSFVINNNIFLIHYFYPLKPENGNSRDSFNDTLLNFGLKWMRYCAVRYNCTNLIKHTEYILFRMFVRKGTG